MVERQQKKGEVLSIRLEPSLRETLEQLARKDGRTLSGYIHHQLTKHADAEKSKLK